MIPFELTSIFTQLQMPDSRAEGARALAAFSGAGQVLLFGKDKENGPFLPALGLPQARCQCSRWQDFLHGCVSDGAASASMPDPRGGHDASAFGISDQHGLSIMVFLGACPEPDHCQAINALLPLLGPKLSAERKLRDADRRKDEFLAMLAHELRNPLAPISMAAQILKIGPINPARLQQTCQIIDRQVIHMSSLLDDLLDVSRVTGGMVPLARELHDMRHIVDDALEQARPLLNARGHHLTINLAQHGVDVCGDSTRLVQIVTNLLNNAAKYTPPGGDIGVRLAQDGGDVVLTVRDNGIGIDSRLLPHVFDLFTQGERSSDRAQGGLGLGLALVRSLAQRHGGAVTARSEGCGRGAEFEVRLPRAPDDGPQCARARQALSGDAGEALSIMIVDDNADAARTLALFLEAHGHRVRAAFDGADGLAMAAQETPRVLLLDIGLPDMDGYALARKLRAQPATRDCVYIALTGYGRPEDRERARAAGFDHHLTKPVNAAALATLLAGVNPQSAH